MRLIDAEELMYELDEQVYMQVDDFSIIANVVRSAPAIEAKPIIHAHWEIEYDEDDNIKKCYCSNCGVGCEPMNYCGFCGAQMDELVSNTDELNSSVKIPVISMEDVPKFAKEMEK